MTVNR